MEEKAKYSSDTFLSPHSASQTYEELSKKSGSKSLPVQIPRKTKSRRGLCQYQKDMCEVAQKIWLLVPHGVIKDFFFFFFFGKKQKKKSLSFLSINFLSLGSERQKKPVTARYLKPGSPTRCVVHYLSRILHRVLSRCSARNGFFLKKNRKKTRTKKGGERKSQSSLLFRNSSHVFWTFFLFVVFFFLF